MNNPFVEGMLAAQRGTRAIANPYDTPCDLMKGKADAWERGRIEQEHEMKRISRSMLNGSKKS